MKINKYIVVTFLLSAIIVSVSAYFSISKSKLTASLADRALTSQHEISRIDHLYTIVSNSDEGVKNYIITGDSGFMILPDSSHARINRTINFIQNDLQDDTVAINDITKLEKYVIAKIDYIRLLAKARIKSFDAAQKIVASGAGTAKMDTMKALVLSIDAKKRLERTQYTQQGQISVNKTNLTIVIGEIIAFLIISIVLFRLHRDMQQRISSENLLQQSEIKFRTIAQNVGSFIYTCDYYGKVTFATPNITAILGYYPDEIIGRHFTFMVAPEYIESLKDSYYKQFKNKVKEETTQFEIITKQGQRKWVKQDVVIFSTLDMTMGFQCTIHDISDQKQS